MIIEGFLVALVVGIGLVFLIGGLLFIRGVVGHLWERWSAFFAALESRRWVETTGKVTRSIVTYTTSRRARAYVPIVRYAYSVGGERFVSERFAFVVTEGVGEEGAAAAGAVVERFRTGSDVRVFYDPEKPKRATLDRNVPRVVGSTLGWLVALVLGGGIMLSLGASIVRGPFEDPPNLGDVPSLGAQLGGLAAAVGALLVLAAGVRSLRGEERRQRRLLRQLASASPTLVHEVRVGELVVVSGRAEELDVEDGGEDELEHAGSLELPFEDAPLVYYDVDAEWFRRTCFNVFGVRDASGVALVEVRATESTVLEKKRPLIEGEVERWLDEQRDDPSDPVPAYPERLRFECIRKGEPVVVVGRAVREGDCLVFHAAPGEPSSLLVAGGTREEVVERLGNRAGRTRALLLLGGGLLVAGAVAMAAP